MRVQVFACLAAAVGYAGLAVAADGSQDAASSRAAEEALRAFHEFQSCAALTDDARRLACYDEAMKRPGPAPTPEQRFGLTPGQVIEKQHLPAPPKDISSQVLAISRPRGLLQLTLANGQVWAAQSADQPDLSIEVGDTVTLTRGVLGSFLLTASRSGNRSMRVSRLK
jgi:hypothetical protein